MGEFNSVAIAETILHISIYWNAWKICIVLPLIIFIDEQTGFLIREKHFHKNCLQIIHSMIRFSILLQLLSLLYLSTSLWCLNVSIKGRWKPKLYCHNSQSMNKWRRISFKVHHLFFSIRL